MPPPDRAAVRRRPASRVCHPHESYPPEGTAIEVYPGIHWLSTPLPFKLRAINLWLLRDGDGWTIVDCGYGADEVKAQWRAVWRATLGDRPVKRLVVTHFHPDHMGNSGWIASEWALEPYMSQAEWLSSMLAANGLNADDLPHRGAFYRRNGLDEARVQKFLTEVAPYRAGCSIPGAYRRIRDGDVLHIDGHRWTVLVGYGHSPEHVCLYCEDLKVMISGDQILPEITPNVSLWSTEPDGDPLRGFLDTIERFRTLLHPESLVLPSHRRPFVGVRERLEELEAHHHQRLESAMRAVGSTGITAGDLLEHLFSGDLDGHQIGFAMNEALAHLNYLMHRGRLARVTDPDGIVRFRRA